MLFPSPRKTCFEDMEVLGMTKIMETKIIRLLIARDMRTIFNLCYSNLNYINKLVLY